MSSANHAGTATMDLGEAKRRLREQAIARRAEVRAKAGSTAPEELERYCLEAVPIPAGAPVSFYWPLADELDPRPLARTLYERGHACALPIVVRRGAPLVFRRWWPGMVLEAASFGLQEPSAEAEEIRPEVLLVPLVAFDDQGYRLGYGGGYFDRTLKSLRSDGGAVLAVGLGFADQEVDAVPRGPDDERLDWMVTERYARRID